MARKPRIHYTETDKALMWDRWRKGESLEKIAPSLSGPEAP
jgi:hypothetical protein